MAALTWLAKTMRDVFAETVGDAIKPLETKIDKLDAKIDGVEERFGNKVDRMVEDIVAEKAPVK